jgi:hypothetical protein
MARLNYKMARKKPRPVLQVQVEGTKIQLVKRESSKPLTHVILSKRNQQGVCPALQPLQCLILFNFCVEQIMSQGSGQPPYGAPAPPGTFYFNPRNKHIY